MFPLDAKLVLLIAGVVFLALSAGQLWRWGRLRPSGRAWVRIGVIFVAVASWLWWSARP